MPDWTHASNHALLTRDAIWRPGMTRDEYITARYSDEPPPSNAGETITQYLPNQGDLAATNWRVL